MDRQAATEIVKAESTLWCIHPPALEAQLIAPLMAGQPVRRVAARPHAPAVGVLSIVGPTVRRASWWSQAFGLTSYDQIRSKLAEYASDRGVDSIVILIDSPGGSVAGLPETADAVARVARIKPVVAVADTLMASAAFWLGSQASEVIAVKSAEIGSVGVICTHFSVHRAMTDSGVDVTHVVSRVSPRKAELSPFVELSPEARDRLQHDADLIGDQFVSAVASGRKVSKSDIINGFGRGGLMFAPAALKVKAIDRIGSVASVLSPPPRPGSLGAAMEGAAHAAAARARRLRLAKLR